MFKKVEQGVSRFAEYLGQILLVLMTLVICFTCFTRYAFAYTASWSEEIALLCMVWFSFLSTALGVRDDSHIGVEVLDSILPKWIIYYFDWFKHLCVISCGVFLIYYGIPLTEVGMYNNFPGLGISSAWLYVIVPISGLAIVVYCLVKLVHLAAHKKECQAEVQGSEG